MTSIPRLCAGVQLKFAAARDEWVLLAPERLFQLDEPSIEILKLIDGQRNLELIVGELTVRFDASREVIAEDVCEMLRQLIDKGVVSI